MEGTKVWARTYIWGRPDLYLGDMRTVEAARRAADEIDVLNGQEPREWPAYDRQAV